MSPQPAHEKVADLHVRERECVRDLHNPKPSIFWSDLLVTAAVGWSSFAASVVLRSYISLFAFFVASLALYRGLCFIHELTHIRPRALPGFEVAWNILFGVPLLLPSFTYIGVHLDHHKVATYGTSRDPEYLPFAKSNLLTVLFAAHSVLIPAFLILRFVLLSPIALVFPPVHRVLAARCSALSMNFSYVREVHPSLLRSLRLWETVTALFGGGVAIALVTGVLPWTIVTTWYTCMAVICVINTLRTLGAHEYASDGKPFDRTMQVLDSIDTPGHIWTELWAPLGLRYHALHHYFPGIPYHHLPEAHRRLIRALPANAPYCRTFSSGLLHSLKRLYVRGRAARSLERSASASS